MYEKEVKLCKGTINGYLYFYDPAHPLAFGGGIVYLHRHLASMRRGRWLGPGEEVHHENEDRGDNSEGNLAVLACVDHRRLHAGGPWTYVCPQCEVSYLAREKRQKYCSVGCACLASRQVERPTLHQLEIDISLMSWVAIGKKYGVSDNAVRKWARAYDLL